MDKITSPKLGMRMESKLKTVGINTMEELIDVGSKEAVARLSLVYPSTCVVILYHLQSTIEGIEMKELSVETKNDLKDFFKSLK